MSEIFFKKVKQAFLETHEGFSTDEVLTRDDLNNRFINACKKYLGDVKEFDLNCALQTLRKQGKLGKVTTRRIYHNHEDYIHACEISARFIFDKYQISIDRALCDPEYKKEFDSIATSVIPNIEPYLLRKGALKLRKARQLRPELVLRVASWNREISIFRVIDIENEPNKIPQNPGIYIFRDSTGYLYIGESHNLHIRIKKHIDHSDRKSLARYFWENNISNITVELHIFDPKSEGRFKRNRRAYESDLIRSRRPKFNVQP